MFRVKHFLLRLLIIFMPAVPGMSFGQSNPSSFQHLTIENGLSDNRINCVIEDAEGFIWIGTDDGLNKFNGYSSKIFRHSADSFSVCSNTIHCAFKDNTNRLWFGGNGLMVCNPVTGKFISYLHDADNTNGLTNNDITAICQDEHGRMWIGTRQGLFSFDESTGKFRQYLHDTSGSVVDVYRKNRIISLVPDHHGGIWMSAIIGLYRFSVTTSAFSAYLFNAGAPNAVAGNQISGLAFDQQGMLWLSVMDSTVCTFDTAEKKFHPVQFTDPGMQRASKRIENILCDAKGRIWMATTFHGLLVFNPGDKRWENHTHDIFDSRSLCDDKTLSLFEDHSGMIWVGTASRGIDRLSSHPDKFLTYTLQPGKPGSLCENDITAAAQDKKGNLWIGSKNGLMYFDRKKNSFLCYRHDEWNSNSLSHDLVFAVAMDSLQNLWVATDNGLNYFNPVTGFWKHFFHDEKNKQGLPGANVYEIIVRSNGEVWAGTSSGFCRFVSRDGTFESQYNTPAIARFTREYYTCIFEDSRKTIWLSTSRSGIFHADGNFNILHAYSHSDGFDAGTVHRFSETPDGHILMASDAGLYSWNPNTATVTRIKNNKGNPDGDIKSVLPENDSVLWIATSHGLDCLVLKNDTAIAGLKNFTAADGLQSNAFNVGPALKLTSGELCFGGINGFNLFWPGAIVYNSVIPPVHLSSFRINDQVVDLSRSDWRLAYDQNNFSFEMAGLNYDRPEKNQFAYQLEGFDKTLNYCGTNHVASYTNVPPGNYSLHVVASNNDGLWNMEGARLNITIVPPFWKTGWFRFVTITLLCLAAYFIYFMRVRKIRREEKMTGEINRQIAEARLVALRAQMNPHFIFNSLNSIQHFISGSEKENALKYLSKFSKLIRLVLENAGRNTITVGKELQMLEFYIELEALRFSNAFTYKIFMDKEINKDVVEIPSMLLQPFVENAIIHGLLNKDTPGKLEVNITRKGNKLVCVVEDNGVGRAAAAIIKEKKMLRDESLGVKMTAERMLMLERTSGKKTNMKIIDLADPDGSPCGTRVEIEVETGEEL